MKRLLKEKKAITLIALVITIIVLLILAGIAVAQLSENGLFENTKLAKEKYQKSREVEDSVLGDYENEITNYKSSSRYTNLGAESEVLWTGDINTANQTASWSKSIEDYSYLIFQAKWGNTNAKQDWILDLETIKEQGYYATNYSTDNSHIIINMHDDCYAYYSFTSNKSLIIPGTKPGSAYVHLVKIIGIK